MIRMIEILLDAITSLGTAAAQNVLISAGENALKNYEDSHAWKKLIVGTGKFFIENENDEKLFFEDLKLALSKENLSKVAKDLKGEDGYDLKSKLYKSFMQLMRKYEVPYETAELYTMKIMYAVIEQLRTVSPVKYEHYFLQEWRNEQEKSFTELQDRVDKISNDLDSYAHKQIAIESSGRMDLNLRRSTCCPSIGIDFFIVDDEHFQDEFEDLRFEELVFIKGRNREETIYCILNELWRLNDKRPIYVVKSLESWNKLQAIEDEGNIYIPWFYADEIVAIDNNTNIFVVDGSTPTFGKKVLELRPRTRDTLSRCLQDAGLEFSDAYSLLSDTHGLYSQIKKKIFKGEFLKIPSWIKGLSEKAKKTCLLIGSWEEIEGDKLIIESLYGDSYDNFIEEVIAYVDVEDPLLYVVRRNGSVYYYLASTENVWSYQNVLTNEKIWQSFEEMVLLVINESENLFTYDTHETLFAQLNGESLFWSETIRKGMLRTLLIKGAYQNDDDTQFSLDKLVKEILKNINNEKQWIYISKFWRELCEISPRVVLERIKKEFVENTGLLSLFQNQSKDILFGRNSYIEILFGIEQYLVQKDFFWRAFRWLLQLDSKQFEYNSNSPNGIFSKVFCTWMNFSSLQTADEKKEAAEIAFQIDPQNIWDYLYSALNHKGRSIVGELSSPKFRECSKTRSTTISEMKKTEDSYYKLLIENMEFSVDRWKKMLDLSCYQTNEMRKDVFKQLSYELSQMSDHEVMLIKNDIRHLVYMHRYFKTSDWSMPEEKIVEYERFFNEIKLNTPEYEYCYLFSYDYNLPLLKPSPYRSEGEFDKNKEAGEKLIKEKIAEFQEADYDLMILATMCAQESFSQLGKHLAKYWNNGSWDYTTFNCLLMAQKTGEFALSYLENISNKESLDYNDIIKDLDNRGHSIEVIAKVYRIEASKTKVIPIVSNASEQIKKAFWKSSICCNEHNESWAIVECKKYATLGVYLDQIYRFHYRKPLPSERILEYFDGIEKMPQSDLTQMTNYHVEQLISLIQDAYKDDVEKCIRISHIELIFMNMLKWENMKCFHRMIKQSPELLAQLVEVVFKKDCVSDDEQPKNPTTIKNMYRIYDKAHFCPAENNGEVDKDELERWIENYRQLLIENNQESLFTMTLGRLFSFSPIGDDGHEPCESVRKMIEKYGDDKMISMYQMEVYNRRGVFSPSAGKEEMGMAEEFKANAQYLEPDYPKTAKIFYGLYKTYKKESTRERMEAENGRY